MVLKHNLYFTNLAEIIFKKQQTNTTNSFIPNSLTIDAIIVSEEGINYTNRNAS